MFYVRQADYHDRRSFLNLISALRSTINTTEVAELNIKLQRLVDVVGNKIMIHLYNSQRKETNQVSL